MTDELRKKYKGIIKNDSNEKLLQRFLWYVNNWNPVDEERCDTYELIKAEILERMENDNCDENEKVKKAVFVLEKKAQYLSKLFGRTITVDEIIDCFENENV